MKKIFYFIIILFTNVFISCSSDDMPLEDGSLNVKELTISIGMPTSESRVDFQDDITKMVWGRQDELIALGYDESGEFVDSETFYLYSGEGTTKAEFKGLCIEGADKYRFLYYDKNQMTFSKVHYETPGYPNTSGYTIGDLDNNYFMQEGFHDYFNHIKQHLFMSTDLVSVKKDEYDSSNVIAAGNLKINSSILKLTIKNLPKELKASNTSKDYLLKFFVNYENVNKPIAVFRYGNDDANIVNSYSLYIAFDPANDLKKGNKIAVELTDGFKTFVTTQLARRMVDYQPGKIYTATIDDQWKWVEKQQIPKTVQWIDLGLSVKWASHNIGANSPEEYGDYFACGETYSKSRYEDYNSWWNGRSRYFDDSMRLMSLDPATANWGNSARVPTLKEAEELIKECTWQKTSCNGINGMLVKGPNGNTIFLPAGGSFGRQFLYDVGQKGWYWTSQLDGDLRQSKALALWFYYSEHACMQNGRSIGMLVRPVCDMPL